MAVVVSNFIGDENRLNSSEKRINKTMGKMGMIA
jgi:hypothetical protein